LCDIARSRVDFRFRWMPHQACAQENSGGAGSSPLPRRGPQRKAPLQAGLRIKGSTLTSSLVPAWCDYFMAVTVVVAHFLHSERRTIHTGDMLELASHIVETKSGHFNPEEFEDHYERCAEGVAEEEAGRGEDRSTERARASKGHQSDGCAAAKRGSGAWRVSETTSPVRQGAG
jgi:hypothetical protein